MVIENIMYFALGLLLAGLVSLIILPAVWKRAVRLTKRRIEAATPITMAEFRADKDQLRAEFALSTRRLEMTVESLRARLAEQLGDVNQARSDLGALNAERSQHSAIVDELETREAELRTRLNELERDNTDLSQQLRMRERELAARAEALATQRDAADPVETLASDDLRAAEARMASAENQLNALLAETSHVVEKSADRPDQLLADQLSLDAEMDALRQQVGHVEATILADWGSDRVSDAELRDKLNGIAASVSRLVYAVDTEAPSATPEEESLYDRVQRFADDGDDSDLLPTAPTRGQRKGSVTDRMQALREIQGR